MHEHINNASKHAQEFKKQSQCTQPQETQDNKTKVICNVTLFTKKRK